MDETLFGPALLESLRVLVRSTPGAFLEIGPHGVGAMTMTTPFAMFTGVVTTDLAPDAGEIGRWAERFRASPLPWSIQVRGEPSPAVLALAAGYGLTERHTEPLMGVVLGVRVPGPVLGSAPGMRAPEPLAGAVPRTGDPMRGGGSAVVEQVRGESADRYLSTLAAGSEAPADALAVLASPALLDDPAVAAYLALSDGDPVATGMTTRAGDVLGVLNMATVPAHRRRGHARAVLVEMLADGIRSGARAAVLQASDAAQHLYASVGFRTVETWTYLIAPD